MKKKKKKFRVFGKSALKNHKKYFKKYTSLRKQKIIIFCDCLFIFSLYKKQYLGNHKSLCSGRKSLAGGISREKKSL